MRNFTIVFNIKVFFVLLITSVVYYLCLKFNFVIDNDYNIISIAIIFPLVFSITSAFNKRQESLKYFSELRSNLISISDFFSSTSEISIQTNREVNKILKNISNENVDLLSSSNSKSDIGKIRNLFAEVQKKIVENEDAFINGEKIDLYRSKREASKCVENLYSLSIHNTPKSLRAYCLLFIYIYPLIFVPSIIANLKPEFELYNIFIFILCLLVSFVLIALYNIQDFIENPFDNKGIDDIKLENYKMDDSEFNI